MPKRTMTVNRIWYHTFRRTKDIGQVNELPDGADLLDLFEEFVKRHLDPARLVHARNETYAEVTDVIRRGRTIAVVSEAGRFGEKGQVKNVRTRRKKSDYDENDVTAVITHGVLVVPRAGDCALVFSERSAGQGGMNHVLDLFIEYFMGRYPNHRMKSMAVVEKAAWLERADLVKVRGTVRKYEADIGGDGKDVIVGDLSHVIVPEEGAKVFPRGVWDRLRNRKINRARFLGFDDDEKLSDIDVTVRGDGQTKTFEIGYEKTPTLRLVISNSGERALTMDKVRERALDEAPDIFKYYGVTWSEADGTRS